MCEIARARAALSGVRGGDDGALDGGWPAKKSFVALADQVVCHEVHTNARGRR
jgi:hypothetical protein